MKKKSTKNILTYTMIAIALIATYVTINSYYTQLAIYQEKELFKLDCIANAVAYKISGEEHSGLVDKYPSQALLDQVKKDSIFMKIYQQMFMAKEMTKVPSSMFTVVKDSASNKFVKVISTNDNEWLSELSGKSRQPDSVYTKGGMIGLYEAEDGLHLGALSPVMSGEGEVVGMLQVEESFDSFMSKAQGQIYTNLMITLVFVIVIGILMFLSVKNILKRQEKLAEEKLELENFRRELLANISHDLRTPLAGIHGYIETLLIKKDSLDEATREKYLSTTLQGTDKLKTLVDELFELSKLESKETTIHIEPFHIQDLVHDIANQFKLSGSEKGVEICVESPEQLPLVKADLGLIDRVLHNLLSNALKYCSKGDKVTIGVREVAGKIQISVTDTGSGIAAEDIPHLFDRFYKGRSSQPGTGLGLAIVKNILVLHDSQYQVQSVLGEGTQFTFSLNI